MFWKLLSIGITVSAMACAGAEYGGISITSITIGTPLEVCFKIEDPTKAPDGTVFVLTIAAIMEPSTDGEHEMEAVPAYVKPGDSSTEQCLKFKGSFTQTADTTDKAMFIILEGTPSVARADTRVTDIKYLTLKAIPTSIPSAQWVGKSGTMHKTTLRITDDVHDWNICVNKVPNTDALICKDGTSPCFALNIGGTVNEDKISICSQTDDLVPVIVQTITGIGQANAPGPIADNITLDYETPKINIISGITKGEALVYGTDGLNICKSKDECDLTLYKKNNQILNIILIQTDDNDAATGSTELEFQDSDLEVYQLAADGSVFEATWTKNQNEYFASRTFDPAETETFHSVNVDCTDIDSGSCFAYFVKVPAANYPYTVSTYPKHGEDINNNNRINTKLPKDARVLDNEFVNITINKQYEKSSGDLKLDICFGDDSKNSLENTQLEVIIIGANKQWKRVIEDNIPQVENQSCYTTTFVLKPDKDSHSLVTALTIQRDVSSNKVISFYRSDFNLAALRAIKPEVDNGNNGSTSTMAIVGAAIAGIACLMALVAAAVMFVMKIKRDNDGLQYPLHRTNIEQDSSYIHGLDNPIPTM